MTITKVTKSPLNEEGVLQDGNLDAYKNLLSALFSYADDAVIATDVDSTIFYVNAKFLQLVALSGEQVIGQQFSQIAPTDKRLHAYKELVQKVISIKKSTSISRVINAASSLHELCTVSPIVNQHQVALGAILIAKSAVIEKPLVEQELRKKAAYQNTMMDSIPFSVWLKDKDSRILAGNQAFAEMAGLSGTKSLEGKTDFDLWPHHLASNYVEDDLRVIESGEHLNLAEKIKGKDGGTVWAETYKAPVVVDGEVIGMVGYARDVSEAKQLLSTISEKDLLFHSLLKNCRF